MKRQILMLVAIVALTAGLTADAFGQANKTVQATVKFDFQIGDRLYPAGKYRVTSFSPQSDNILQIISLGDANKNDLIVATHLNAGKVHQTPRLVFHKYGENYFLTEITLNTEQWGFSIQPSRRQRERENNLASRVSRNK